MILLDGLRMNGQQREKGEGRPLIILALLYVAYFTVAFSTSIKGVLGNGIFLFVLLLIPVSVVLTVLLSKVLVMWARTHIFFAYVPKFALVGIGNTILDIAVLNMFIYAISPESALVYGVLKGASFLVAVSHSFVWNKYWVFGGLTDTWWRGYGSFVLATVVGLLINVFISVLILITLRDFLNFDNLIIIADIGAIVGTLFSMAWNYVSYRFLFKKN